MGFLSFSKYFVFIAFAFLDFEFLRRFEIYDDLDMGWVHFVGFD